MTDRPFRWMLAYWGRRGFSLFAYQIMRAAAELENTTTFVSVSRDNEEFERFRSFGDALWPVRLFSSGPGALTALYRVPALRRELRRRVEADRLDAVVTLMPHVWSPLVAEAAIAGGARYATIVHDAAPHAGDRTGLVEAIYRRDSAKADHVVTLSAHVATGLRAGRLKPGARLHTLFHPVLDLPPSTAEAWTGRRPLRLLSLGRMLSYKGIPLLAEAFAEIRARGLPVELSVMGEGDMGEAGDRLRALGAGIVNRWLTNEEIAAALAGHDALILTHRDASQSGVIALAHGAGLPVIATDVGGFREQIDPGRTGLLVEADASRLADAVAELGGNPVFLAAMAAEIRARLDARSVRRFVEDLRGLLAP